jgi:hypothetical protein
MTLPDNGDRGPRGLTDLLNQMVRRGLDPGETDALRAAVRATAGPILHQLPGAPAAQEEVWSSLLDHFAAPDPAAAPISDGAEYVRQIARAVVVDHAVGASPVQGPPQVPVRPPQPAPAPPQAVQPPAPSQPIRIPAPLPAHLAARPLPPARGNTGPARWVPAAVAAGLVLLIVGGVIAIGALRRPGGGDHAAVRLPGPPGASTAVPLEQVPSPEPSTGPTGTSAPETAEPSPAVSPSAERSRRPPVTTGPRPPATTQPLRGVVFTGTSAAPTVTVQGSGFGAAPSGTGWNTTACGTYTDNGKDYGPALWFRDPAYFGAGNGSCIGIKLVSWSATKVVFRFGNSYNTFEHWYVTAGDPYEVAVAGQLFTGTVAFS